MMMNLFAMFDTNLYYLNPFLFTFLIAAFLTNLKVLWPNNSSIFTLKNSVLMKASAELKQDISKLVSTGMQPKFKNLGASKLFMMIFYFVFSLNFLSLYPMVFSSTSHISVTLPASLILWVSVIMVSLEESSINFLSHLTPLGTPTPLMSFMVCIETVSTLIRPITLAVRLTANLVAGHLLLFLLSKMVLIMGKLFICVTPLMLVLGTLEIMVSVIQGYVITLLTILYFKESF